jgi:hypothetical protein
VGVGLSAIDRLAAVYETTSEFGQMKTSTARTAILLRFCAAPTEPKRQHPNQTGRPRLWQIKKTTPQSTLAAGQSLSDLVREFHAASADQARLLDSMQRRQRAQHVLLHLIHPGSVAVSRKDINPGHGRQATPNPRELVSMLKT